MDAIKNHEEEMHICGITGGKCAKWVGCGKKEPMSDTNMIDNTSFCIPCYERYEEVCKDTEDEDEDEDEDEEEEEESN